MYILRIAGENWNEMKKRFLKGKKERLKRANIAWYNISQYKVMPNTHNGYVESDVTYITIDQIEPSTESMRYVDDTLELSESIAQYGIRIPIKVTVSENGMLLLTDSGG